MNQYIGHDSPLFGIEEHRLVGGRGDGLRLFAYSFCFAASDFPGGCFTLPAESPLTAYSYRNVPSALPEPSL